MRVNRILPALLAVYCAPMMAQAQNVGPGGAVLTDKDAYVLFPPQVISAPDVKTAAWSSDGKYVLMTRQTMNITPELARQFLDVEKRQPGTQPPPPQSSIAVWNARTRQTDTVWRNTDGLAAIEDARWLPGVPAAVAIVRQTNPSNPNAPQQGPEMVWSIFYVLGESARSREIARFAEPPMISFSPSRGLAILQGWDTRLEDVPQPDGSTKRLHQTRNYLRVLRDNGTLGPEAALPAEIRTPRVEWSADGSQPYLSVLSKTQVKGQPARFDWFSLDTRTGQTALLNAAPALYEPRPADLPIRVTPSRITAKQADTTQMLPVLWLESAAPSDQPRAVIAAESNFGELSPEGDAVLYIAKGAAWVSPLMRLSREEFLAARRKALIAQKTSNAKQLGLALLMYAQDFDETFPLAGQDINGIISPYLKNTDLFDGFSYTYGGGPLSGIAAPAETQLGFVTGPGGRAIIYADGHVKWKDD